MRELSKPLDRRLVAPPPSPYAPSKGFRLLDESGEPQERAPVERPRLDPNRHYVFSESTPSGEDLVPSRARHNDDWFLVRSSNRSTVSIVLRRVGVVVLLALVVTVVVTYYYNQHPARPATTTTTTTTTSRPSGAGTTTTTVAFPSSFSATTTSGSDATYDVPAHRYEVTVTGAHGPTWAVYLMGAKNTLEWQNTVALGRHESLTMVGDSKVTIGSPSSATVTVDGRPVNFPTPLPTTLNLVFVALGANATTS